MDGKQRDDPDEVKHTIIQIEDPEAVKGSDTVIDDSEEGAIDSLPNMTTDTEDMSSIGDATPLSEMDTRPRDVSDKHRRTLPDIFEDADHSRQPGMKKDDSRRHLLRPTVSLPDASSVKDMHNLQDKWSCVRNLPVSIAEKREFRNTIIEMEDVSVSWFSKLRNDFPQNVKSFMSHFEIWNDPLRLIEGQHGCAVVAYFLFVRWLLYLNLVIFLLNFFFLISPQMLFTNMVIDGSVGSGTSNSSNVTKRNYSSLSVKYNEEVYFPIDDGPERHMGGVELATDKLLATPIEKIISVCKELYIQQFLNRTTTGSLAAFQNFIQGTGPLERTLLFAGSYTPYVVTPLGHYYKISYAFICVLFVTFMICCAMMIKYTSTGVQEAFAARAGTITFYANKVFSAWNFDIDDPVTAEKHKNKFILDVKTNLHEDRHLRKVARRSTKDWIKLWVIRVIIHCFVVLWVGGSIYLISYAAQYQMQVMAQEHWDEGGLRMLYIQFLPSGAVVILNSISPSIFEILIYFEDYSSQTNFNISIFRNVFLYLSGIFVLLNTMQRQVSCKPKDICGVGVSNTCHAPRCWETYVGQQLFKLSLADMGVYVAIFFAYDLVQYFITSSFENRFTRFWGHPIFFLPIEVLALINSQTITWLGVLYSPLLPLVAVLKLIFIFYIKKTKVMMLCEPAEESYHASRFNAMFVLILFISFFISVMVHSYAIMNIPPSRGCGPYRYYGAIIKSIPDQIRYILSILMSYWFVSLTLVTLSCLIHYHVCVYSAQKALAKRLRADLVLESSDRVFLLKQIDEVSQDERVKVKVEDRLKARR